MDHRDPSESIPSALEDFDDSPRGEPDSLDFALAELDPDPAEQEAARGELRRCAQEFNQHRRLEECAPRPSAYIETLYKVKRLCRQLERSLATLQLQIPDGVDLALNTHQTADLHHRLANFASTAEFARDLHKPDKGGPRNVVRDRHGSAHWTLVREVHDVFTRYGASEPTGYGDGPFHGCVVHVYQYAIARESTSWLEDLVKQFCALVAKRRRLENVQLALLQRASNGLSRPDDRARLQVIERGLERVLKQIWHGPAGS